MSATPAQFTKPRPIFECLPSAVRAALDHGNSFQDINPSRWSETYGNCGIEAVKSEWERQQWERTQKPSNQFEEFDK